jgi:hypothetical protein
MNTHATRQRDERLGAAMIALRLIHDDEAVELLARSHEDPAALAVAVAHAADMVLVLTGLRPGQANAFEKCEPYRHALWLAQDGAGEEDDWADDHRDD